jgi:hypothetical protein
MVKEVKFKPNRVREKKSLGRGGGDSIGSCRTRCRAIFVLVAARIRLRGRVPRRQEGRPNHARHQNHVELVSDRNVPEIEQLDRDLEGARDGNEIGTRTSPRCADANILLSLMCEQEATYPENPLRLLWSRRKRKQD